MGIILSLGVAQATYLPSLTPEALQQQQLQRQFGQPVQYAQPFNAYQEDSDPTVTGYQQNDMSQSVPVEQIQQVFQPVQQGQQPVQQRMAVRMQRGVIPMPNKQILVSKKNAVAAAAVKHEITNCQAQNALTEDATRALLWTDDIMSYCQSRRCFYRPETDGQMRTLRTLTKEVQTNCENPVYSSTVQLQTPTELSDQLSQCGDAEMAISNTEKGKAINSRQPLPRCNVCGRYLEMNSSIRSLNRLGCDHAVFITMETASHAEDQAEKQKIVDMAMPVLKMMQNSHLLCDRDVNEQTAAECRTLIQGVTSLRNGKRIASLNFKDEDAAVHSGIADMLKLVRGNAVQVPSLLESSKYSSITGHAEAVAPSSLEQVEDKSENIKHKKPISKKKTAKKDKIVDKDVKTKTEMQEPPVDDENVFTAERKFRASTGDAGASAEIMMSDEPIVEDGGSSLETKSDAGKAASDPMAFYYPSTQTQVKVPPSAPQQSSAPPSEQSSAPPSGQFSGPAAVQLPKPVQVHPRHAGDVHSPPPARSGDHAHVQRSRTVHEEEPDPDKDDNDDDMDDDIKHLAKMRKSMLNYAGIVHVHPDTEYTKVDEHYNGQAEHHGHDERGHGHDDHEHGKVIPSHPQHEHRAPQISLAAHRAQLKSLRSKLKKEYGELVRKKESIHTTELKDLTKKALKRLQQLHATYNEKQRQLIIASKDKLMKAKAKDGHASDLIRSSAYDTAYRRHVFQGMNDLGRIASATELKATALLHQIGVPVDVSFPKKEKTEKTKKTETEKASEKKEATAEKVEQSNEIKSLENLYSTTENTATYNAAEEAQGTSLEKQAVDVAKSVGANEATAAASPSSLIESDPAKVLQDHDAFERDFHGDFRASMSGLHDAFPGLVPSSLLQIGDNADPSWDADDKWWAQLNAGIMQSINTPEQAPQQQVPQASSLISGYAGAQPSSLAAMSGLPGTLFPIGVAPVAQAGMVPAIPQMKGLIPFAPPVFQSAAPAATNAGSSTGNENVPQPPTVSDTNNGLSLTEKSNSTSANMQGNTTSLVENMTSSFSSGKTVASAIAHSNHEKANLVSIPGAGIRDSKTEDDVQEKPKTTSHQESATIPKRDAGKPVVTSSSYLETTAERFRESAKAGVTPENVAASESPSPGTSANAPEKAINFRDASKFPMNWPTSYTQGGETNEERSGGSSRVRRGVMGNVFRVRPDGTPAGEPDEYIPSPSTETSDYEDDELNYNQSEKDSAEDSSKEQGVLRSNFNVQASAVEGAAERVTGHSRAVEEDPSTIDSNGDVHSFLDTSANVQLKTLRREKKRRHGYHSVSDYSSSFIERARLRTAEKSDKPEKTQDKPSQKQDVQKEDTTVHKSNSTADAATSTIEHRGTKKAAGAKKGDDDSKDTKKAGAVDDSIAPQTPEARRDMLYKDPPLEVVNNRRGIEDLYHQVDERLALDNMKRGQYVPFTISAASQGENVKHSDPLGLHPSQTGTTKKESTNDKWETNPENKQFMTGCMLGMFLVGGALYAYNSQKNNTAAANGQGEV